MKLLFFTLFLFLGCNDNPSVPSDDSNNYPIDWDSNSDGYLDNLNNYENNGSISSSIFLNDTNIGSDGDVLAAFIEGSQRGLAFATQIPIELEQSPYAGTYQFLMLIYSNTVSDEVITFKFYDNETDTVYDVIETIEFTSDMILGNAIEPILLTIQ